mgnify:CR=1 FL=1
MKRYSIRYIGLFMFIAILAGGCSQLSGSSDGNSNSQKATASDNRFAFRLYEQLKSDRENVFVSPYSISSALAMTYTGAREQTRAEMSDALGFPEDNEQLGKQYRALANHLHSLADSGLVLNVANSLWAQKDYGFSRDFVRTNRDYFSAGLKEMDFKRQHRAIREQINQWVEQKTNDKIQDMIAEGVLDRMTRLVLVNAIYFNGKWEHPFNEKRTRQDVFHTSGEMSPKIPFMNQSLTLPYYETDRYQAIALPYAGKKVSMVILLPRKAAMMKELEEQLDAGFYQALLDSLKPQEVDLFIPRFRIEQKYNLNDPLQAMGMNRAFGGKADFSGMTGKKDLYISSVVHQSFVEVDEKGTEAAAATGVVMRKTSVVRKKEFKADHPFIFMIRDDKTDTLLFLGKLGNPKE